MKVILAYIASNLRNNPKRFWSYVKSKTKVRYSIPTLKFLDNNEAITDNEKAAMLNSFFSSVFTKEFEDLNNFPHTNSHQYTEPLSNISITTEQVYCKLRSVKSFKSPGPDKFHPKILTEAAKQLSVPLCKLCLIFSKSLDGFLPSDWKVANVIPIFKKGERSQPGNYRPISLISAVCKVFESIIRDSIVRHS